MKRRYLAVLALAVLAALFLPCPSASHAGEASYLGQEPPSLEPGIFAPALLSRTQPEWAFCAELSPDNQELYFSEFDPDLGIDRIMWQRREAQAWTDPRPLPFDSLHNSNDSRISPDGRRLFFRSKRPLPGSNQASELLLLWWAERVGKTWGEPQPVLFDGQPARTSHVGVAENGNLYFSYRGPENERGADVHRAQLIKGAYSAPENLGPKVNTPYAEGDVYVAPDESFLIVTIWDHPENNGDSDLYISYRQPDLTWTPLQNLGSPINTSANENCAAFSPDGSVFFYVGVTTNGHHPSIATYWVDASVVHRHRPD